MNSKLLLGSLGFCSIISVFVACGSGTIDPFTLDDEVATLSTGSLDKDKSISACLADLECQANYEAANNPPLSVEAPSSSSIDNPILDWSSSSSLIQISSEGPVFPVSSSSSVFVLPPQTSGGVTGTCAPTPAVAELGDTVTWSFTRDLSTEVGLIGISTFDWGFEGGSQPTYSGKGVTGVNVFNTYNTSGTHATILSINADSNPIICSPVQINGVSITGCECVVDNASPDVASGGIVNWVVTGCFTPPPAMITGYSWDDQPAEPTGILTYAFTQKGETRAPIVKVYNNDNTIQSVQCPVVTASNSADPDYVLDGTPTGTYTLQAGSYSMQYACNASAFHQPDISVSASGDWAPFNVIYATSSNPSGESSGTPQHIIPFTSLFGAWPADNNVPTEMISITVDHAFTIKCQ